MLFIHARSLTADDMPFVGNNIQSAVRRERRRPHAPAPIGDRHSDDDSDGPAQLVLLGPTPRPAA